MITTETLEEMLRQERYEYNSYPAVMKIFLQGYHETREALLDTLINISKEEEKECIRRK